MGKRITIISFIALTLVSCDKEEPSPDTSVNKVVGNWIVVREKQKSGYNGTNENENGIMSQWGGNQANWYVETVSLEDNRTVRLNSL